MRFCKPASPGQYCLPTNYRERSVLSITGKPTRISGWLSANVRMLRLNGRACGGSYDPPYYPTEFHYQHSAESIMQTPHPHRHPLPLRPRKVPEPPMPALQEYPDPLALADAQCTMHGLRDGVLMADNWTRHFRRVIRETLMRLQKKR